jgi:hypothetical protein
MNCFTPFQRPEAGHVLRHGVCIASRRLASRSSTRTALVRYGILYAIFITTSRVLCHLLAYALLSLSPTHSLNHSPACYLAGSLIPKLANSLTSSLFHSFHYCYYFSHYYHRYSYYQVNYFDRFNYYATTAAASVEIRVLLLVLPSILLLLPLYYHCYRCDYCCYHYYRSTGTVIDEV